MKNQTRQVDCRHGPDFGCSRAPREELIELVGQLLGHNRALAARIAELEGQQEPPTAEVKKPEPPSWVKANRPRPPRQGT